MVIQIGRYRVCRSGECFYCTEYEIQELTVEVRSLTKPGKIRRHIKLPIFSSGTPHLHNCYHLGLSQAKPYL